MSSSDGETGSEIDQSRWFDKSKRNIFPVYPIMNDILVYYVSNCERLLPTGHLRMNMEYEQLCKNSVSKLDKKIKDRKTTGNWFYGLYICCGINQIFNNIYQNAKAHCNSLDTVLCTPEIEMIEAHLRRDHDPTVLIWTEYVRANQTHFKGTFHICES